MPRRLTCTWLKWAGGRPPEPGAKGHTAGSARGAWARAPERAPCETSHVGSRRGTKLPDSGAGAGLTSGPGFPPGRAVGEADTSAHPASPPAMCCSPRRRSAQETRRHGTQDGAGTGEVRKAQDGGGRRAGRGAGGNARLRGEEPTSSTQNWGQEGWRGRNWQRATWLGITGSTTALC